MKLLLALCLVGMVAASRPPSEAQLTSYENVNNGRGNYRFGYSQSDGTNFEQEGTLKNEGQEDESLAVRGQFSWIGPDGVTYIVTYVADENGYQPEIKKQSYTYAYQSIPEVPFYVLSGFVPQARKTIYAKEKSPSHRKPHSLPIKILDGLLN